MNMMTLRRWATPFTIGAFLLMSVTGILMFFEVRLGLIKLAHEWLSWLMVIAVGLHITINWRAFTRYLYQKSALAVIILFAVITITAMLIPNDGPKGPRGGGGQQMQASQVLLHAPLNSLANLVSKTPEALQAQLVEQGLKVEDMDTSLEEVAHENHRNPMEVLFELLK